MLVAGWREWVGLPGLSIPAIKAKVDTGARTSCLHAHRIEPFTKNGKRWVRLELRPLQYNDEVMVVGEAEIIAERDVTDSGGHTERRYVIRTEVTVAGEKWPVDLTLTNRNGMRFRMLLGREALKGRLQVDPIRSFMLGRLPSETVLRLYNARR